MGITYDIPSLYMGSLISIGPCILVWLTYYVLLYLKHEDDDRFENSMQEFVYNYTDLRKNYISKIPDRELLNVGFGAIVDSLGKINKDAYTFNYKSGDEEKTSEDIKCYKIHFGKDKDNYYVKGVIGKSETIKKDIELADVVLKVNGVDVTQMEKQKFYSLVYDNDSDQLELVLERKGKTHTVVIEKELREKEYKPVEGTIIYEDQKKYGYLLLKSFCEDSSRHFHAALNYLLECGIDELVIDLQDNLGGKEIELITIASEFLKKGDVIYYRAIGTSKRLVPTKVLSGEERFKLPISVLVNERSASCSEILASTLKDNLNATIIGSPTFGKNVGQSTRTGSKLYNYQYTFFKWFRPNKKSIKGEGVIPDILTYPTFDNFLGIKKKLYQGRYEYITVSFNNDNQKEDKNKEQSKENAEPQNVEEKIQKENKIENANQ